MVWCAVEWCSVVVSHGVVMCGSMCLVVWYCVMLHGGVVCCGG